MFRQLVKSVALLGIITNQNRRSLSKLGVVGLAFNKGQLKDGVEQGPQLLRSSGLIDILKETRSVKDYDDIVQCKPDPFVRYDNMRNVQDIFGYNKTAFHKIKEIRKENDQLLTIGGDHSVALGSISASLDRNPKISTIWVDAHPDVNTNCSSKSGNVHGMVLSLLLKEFREHWKDSSLEKWAKNALPVKNLIYVGIRDIDPFEEELICKLGIKAYGMDFIKKKGINRAVAKILEQVDGAPIHISFDIDALDARIAPSTGTPVPDGLSLDEGICLIQNLAENCCIESFDMVEVNPKIGTETDMRDTAEAAIKIIKTAFPKTE